LFVGCCVNLDMVRFISLLLFIGLAWGQVDLDKLVLKDGTTYFGEYSKIEGKIVYFKPHDAFGFQPITFNTIHKLELANGLKLVTNGKIEQDRLVLKDGTRYLGEFSTIDGENVLFKPEGAFGFQPITFNAIHKLELAYGLKLVTNGKIEQDRLVFKDGQIIIGDGKNSLTPEENQKLSTKAKVIIGCGCIIVVFIILGSGGGGGFDMSGFDYDACFDPNCG